MLRLTRVKEEVHLHLFEKERRFSLNLMKGFGVAILFHAAFFLIFRVVSPEPPLSIDLLPPSCVEIDLGAPLASTSAPPSRSFETTRAPTLYEMAPGGICSIEKYSEFCWKEPDFSEIEAFDFIPLELDFDHD